MPHYNSIQDFLLANGFTYEQSDEKFCRGFIAIPVSFLAGRPLSYFEERYTLGQLSETVPLTAEQLPKSKEQKTWELTQASSVLSFFGEYGQTETASTYRILVAAFSAEADMNLRLHGKQTSVPVQAVREKICEVVANIGPGKATVLDQVVEEALYQEFIVPTLAHIP